MKRTFAKSTSTGFGMIELMIAMVLGLLVLAGVLAVFAAQRRIYQSASSQSLIQNGQNALSAIITPVIRGAGFTGCNHIGSGVRTYLPTRATPLTFDTSSAVKGFAATSLPAKLVGGAANDSNADDWTPALDASFLTSAVGGVTQGSDVLVLIGAPPGVKPVGVTAFGTDDLTVNDATDIADATQMLAISDCGKSSIFQITSAKNNVLTFASGPTGTPLYPVGSQAIPIQQTAFFVARRKNSGQNALFEGVMTIPAGGSAANATWSISELIPGVSSMQVRYGSGGNGRTAEYVDASLVNDWTAITSVKLGFLVEGQPGSSDISTNPTSVALFDKLFTLAADTRLRHTFYMTVNARNSTL